MYRFNIAHHVPLDSTISFADLAELCDLSENDLKRIIRYTAVYHRVFSEPKEGYVAHTAASRLLVDDKTVGDRMALNFAEGWPAHSRVCTSLMVL